MGQMADVANGLKYMHDLRMVHGDLKGVYTSLNNGCLHISHPLKRLIS